MFALWKQAILPIGEQLGESFKVKGSLELRVKMLILNFSALGQGNMKLFHHFSIIQGLNVGILNFMLFCF